MVYILEAPRLYVWFAEVSDVRASHIGGNISSM